MKFLQLTTVFIFTLLLFSFMPSRKIVTNEPQGYAVIISVPKVNNPIIRIKYGMPAGDSYADLPGASSDGEKMYNILIKEGFKDSNIIRIGKNATDTITEAFIMNALKKTAAKVKANDLFVFYYSGHGTSVKDEPNGDEADGKDEALVTYNSYLIDDKLNAVYKKNFSATRNIMIMDACHGGSLYELFKKPSLNFMDNKKETKFKLNNNAESCKINAATDVNTGFGMIYYGASRDENNGYDTGTGGYFTLAFSGLYHPVYWKNIKPRDLACKISEKMQALDDPGKGEIQYTECGKLSEEFKNSPLFKIK